MVPPKVKPPGLEDPNVAAVEVEDETGALLLVLLLLLPPNPNELLVPAEKAGFVAGSAVLDAESAAADPVFFSTPDVKLNAFDAVVDAVGAVAEVDVEPKLNALEDDAAVAEVDEPEWVRSWTFEGGGHAFREQPSEREGARAMRINS